MNVTANRMRIGSPSAFALLSLAMLAAIVFWLAAATPYFTTRREAFGQFPELFWDRRYALWMHIFGGTVAMFSGPVQIWLGETRQRLPFHRTFGYVYISGAAITCAAAFYMSVTTPVGLVFGAGLFGMALACTVATTMAILSIRSRNFVQHREWMIRSYVVILSFVFFRFLAVGMEAMQIGGQGDAGQLARVSVAAWASWAVPMVITEMMLQLPKTKRA